MKKIIFFTKKIAFLQKKGYFCIQFLRISRFIGNKNYSCRDKKKTYEWPVC